MKQENISQFLAKVGLPAFPLDNGGFPVPGYIVKYYREQMKYTDSHGKERSWTQANLAQLLNVTETTVNLMENKNTGLDSIERRRLLVDILNIPPALLGLASLETLAAILDGAQGQPPSKSVGSNNTLRLYQDAFDLFSQTHATGTAQHSLAEIERWIERIVLDLPSLTDAQKKVAQKNLWDFHALVAKIYGEDLEDYARSFTHLETALELATELESADLQAASLYRSAAIRIAKKNYAFACVDLDGALLAAKHARPHIRGAVLCDAALARALNKGSEPVVSPLLDQAEKLLDKPVDDGVMNFSSGKYLLLRARTLLALKRPGKALEYLDDAEKALQSTQRRRRVYINAARAECSIRFKRPQYDVALALIEEVLEESRLLRSDYSIGYVKRLYELLAASSYGTSPQVVDLSRTLKEWRK